MENITMNNAYSKCPAGQPAGYDYYIPFDTEESRLLEKDDYNVKMSTVTVATIIAESGHNSANFGKYYEELAENERAYDRRKNSVSDKYVVPFINSLHGEESNVSVRWTHSFKTPFIAVKYANKNIDHAIEKDLIYGRFSCEEIGIADDVIEKLAELSSNYQVNNDIVTYIMRNYPDPTEAQSAKFDAFIAKRNEDTFAYDELKADVTTVVNAFLAERGVDVNTTALQWNIDFASKIVTISKVL